VRQVLKNMDKPISFLMCRVCGQPPVRDAISPQARAFTCSRCLMRRHRTHGDCVLRGHHSSRDAAAECPSPRAHAHTGDVDENPRGDVTLQVPASRPCAPPQDRGVTKRFSSTSQKGGRPRKSPEETRRRKREWMRRWRGGAT
jgi:hypothetical protein